MSQNKLTPELRQKIQKYVKGKERKPGEYGVYEDYKKDGVIQWSTGFGHLLGPNKDDWKKFDTNKDGVMSEEEAHALLKKDIDRFTQTWLPDVKVPLSDNQIIAITSLAYNRGENHSILKEMVKRLNAEDYEGASELFTATGKDDAFPYLAQHYEPNAKGHIIAKGLDARRKKEQELFGFTPSEPRERGGIEPEAGPAPKENWGAVDFKLEPKSSEPKQSKFDPSMLTEGIFGGTAQAAEAEPEKPEPKKASAFASGPKPYWSLDTDTLADEDWGVMGPPDKDEHIVKKGETLSKIAEANNMDWRELARLNNLDNPDLIFPNQKIRLK